MIEVIGNLWDYEAEVTAITTNGVVRDGLAVMGGGCALECAQRYPHIPGELANNLFKWGNHCWEFFEDDRTIVTFPTKEHYSNPSTKERILESAEGLIELMEFYVWQSVVIPRPGCGLGGLEWDEVKEWLTPIFDDRFHIITFPEGG